MAQADGVLERLVQAEKVLIWVPVMPSTIILPKLFGKRPANDVAWRRFAFDRAHMTLFDPHRDAGATWQNRKRMVFLVKPKGRLRRMD